MRYGSLPFYCFLCVLTIVYYIVPSKIRWVVLLIGSCLFYYMTVSRRIQIVVFLFSVAVSFAAGLLIAREKKKQADGKTRRPLLFGGIVLSVLPLFLSKVFTGPSFSFLSTIGISFYSLQIISYLADIDRGRIEAQTNPLKYTLYISFFPHIIQGPIPRYDRLAEQLFTGHAFDMENIMHGINLSLWGLFLKLMIADKIDIATSALFTGGESFTGLYVWIAGLLYLFQVYTDFLSCVKMSQGAARMFGIRLTDNFRQPFFSRSIREYWSRWHITLGAWLRDYIYFPLGGSRKGRMRQCLNLVITFVISGLWHGTRFQYVVWGAFQAFYQIIEERAGAFRNRIVKNTGSRPGTAYRVWQSVRTFLLFTPSVVLFRADSFRQGVSMVVSGFTKWNPWILFDGSLCRIGLDLKDWILLFLSFAVLLGVSLAQVYNISVSSAIRKSPLPLRWLVYLGVIWVMWIFGTYGFGFNAKDFIYGGF